MISCSRMDHTPGTQTDSLKEGSYRIKNPGAGRIVTELTVVDEQVPAFARPDAGWFRNRKLPVRHKAATLRQRVDFNEMVSARLDFQGISKRPPHAFPFDRHPVTVFQRYPRAETESVRAVEMHVYITRTPVNSVFEMVMFQVGHGMGHIGFTGFNIF